MSRSVTSFAIKDANELPSLASRDCTAPSRRLREKMQTSCRRSQVCIPIPQRNAVLFASRNAVISKPAAASRSGGLRSSAALKTAGRGLSVPPDPPGPGLFACNGPSGSKDVTNSPGPGNRRTKRLTAFCPSPSFRNVAGL